jgi:hypothetical protein
MTPLTFEQAKSRIPEFILLKPKTDFFRADDKVWRFQSWEEIDVGWIGQHVLPAFIAIRPIPEEIRDAIARNMLTNLNAKADTGELQKVVWPFTSWLLEQSQ